MFLTGRLEMIRFLCLNISLQVCCLSIIVFVGSCAGIVEHVGMFPIDTIKVSVN